jgi:hypothetical protein
MSFTTYLNLEKPDYKTLRYDLILNSNFDAIDTYIVGAKLSINVTAPSTPADGSFYSYANDVSAVACPHWKLQSGDIIHLCKQNHIADPTTDTTSLMDAVKAVLVVLENLGLLATA